MSFRYITSGTCSRAINIELDENDVITDLSFEGGCNGNLKGVSKLCTGMQAQKVIELLEGTTCGFKNTSCPDQLSKALKKYLSEKGE